LGRRLQSWRTVPIRVASGERHIATPSLALHAVGLEWLRDIAGRKVAVLGSGDNQVAFALAGMGVAVTSVDISEEQIEVARSHAAAVQPRRHAPSGEARFLMAVGSKPSWSPAGSDNLLRKNGVGETRRIE
jgi:SAM-dependent methyltransferase